MNNETKKGAVPGIRFPEFRNSKAWTEPTLGEISEPIAERVGGSVLPTVSITAGAGFVLQAEKFGRDISGEQYKNYIVLRSGEFAYNKGNSKKFPQGCVCQLKEFEQVAAPNAFISFRFKDDFVAEFFKGYFDNNFHGRQLQKFISSGARSDGLLNISSKDFFSVVLPTPVDKAEQQKIAACLSSLDETIAAEVEGVEALKAHKRGLMQGLFPAEGARVPRLRFGGFEGEWEEGTLGQSLARHPEYGIGAPAVPYSESLPTYLRITDISEDGHFIRNEKVSVGRKVTEENYLSEGDIVFARTGASVGKSYKYRLEDGRLVFAGFLIRVRPDMEKLDSEFLFQFLSTRQYWRWVAFSSARSGQPGINGNEYSSMPLPLPPTLAEQQKIAATLSALDDLITAQSQKIAALKTHKRGLMQALFPGVPGAS